MNKRNLKEYTPGFNIEDVRKKYNLKKVTKLASNENPFISDKVKELLRSNKNTINLYPKSQPNELHQQIAKILRHNFGEKNILIGNGSNEILEFIARARLDSRSEVIIPKHSFLVYEIISKLQGARIITSSPCLDKNSCNYLGVDINSILKKVSRRTKLIFIANPGNPTGTYIDLLEVESLIKSVSSRITIVVDEAYYEYLDKDKESAVSLVNKYKNLFVTRSFSKIYGIAALRIGYGVSTVSNISDLKIFKQPFNTNGIAQNAALLALKDKKFYKLSKENNKTLQQKLMTRLDSLSIRYLGSNCNFITFESGKYTSQLFNYQRKKE